jgi:hypothetical protein
MNETETKPKPKLAKDIFATESCSRCGGSGQYSYCQMYGTRCFKCGGAGWQFTKRGKADYERWRAAVDAITTKPVTELRVGDSAKASKDFRRYYPVKSIEGPTRGHWGRVVAGETIWSEVYKISFEKPIVCNGPLGRYEQQDWDVEVTGTVQIHPGANLMPQAESFVTKPRQKKTQPLD